MKRGRPLIGKKPLTVSERQRRFLDKLRRASEPELKALRAQVKKLQRENVALKLELQQRAPTS
jgi:hypothetical protein